MGWLALDMNNLEHRLLWYMKAVSGVRDATPARRMADYFRQDASAIKVRLQALKRAGLVSYRKGGWGLTAAGKRFIEPSPQEKENRRKGGLEANHDWIRHHSHIYPGESLVMSDGQCLAHGRSDELARRFEGQWHDKILITSVMAQAIREAEWTSLDGCARP